MTIEGSGDGETVCGGGGEAGVPGTCRTEHLTPASLASLGLGGISASLMRCASDGVRV